MDFHSLPRKELQALCKKSMIPANLSNTAMADALKALHEAEGIEEFPDIASDIQSPPVQPKQAVPSPPPALRRTATRRNATIDAGLGTEASPSSLPVQPKPAVPSPQPASRKTATQRNATVDAGLGTEAFPSSPPVQPKPAVPSPQPISRRTATRRNATVDAGLGTEASPSSPPQQAPSGRRVMRSTRTSSRTVPKDADEKHIDVLPFVEIPGTPATAAAQTRTRHGAKTRTDPEIAVEKAERDEEDQPRLPPLTPAVCVAAHMTPIGRRASTRAASQQLQMPFAPEQLPDLRVNHRTTQSSRRPGGSSATVTSGTTTSRARGVRKLVDLLPDSKEQRDTISGAAATDAEHMADANMLARMNEKMWNEGVTYVLQGTGPVTASPAGGDLTLAEPDEELVDLPRSALVLRNAASVPPAGCRPSTMSFPAVVESETLLSPKQQTYMRRCSRTNQSSTPPAPTSVAGMVRTTRSRARGLRKMVDMQEHQSATNEEVDVVAEQPAHADPAALMADSGEKEMPDEISTCIVQKVCIPVMKLDSTTDDGVAALSVEESRVTEELTAAKNVAEDYVDAVERDTHPTQQTTTSGNTQNKVEESHVANQVANGEALVKTPASTLVIDQLRDNVSATLTTLTEMAARPASTSVRLTRDAKRRLLTPVSMVAQLEKRTNDRIPRSSRGAAATESRAKSMRSSTRVTSKIEALPTRVQEFTTENMDAIAVGSDDSPQLPDPELEEDYPINMSSSIDQKSANEAKEKTSDKIPWSSQGSAATESRAKSMRSSTRVISKIEALPNRVQELATENMNAIAVASDDAPQLPDAELEEDYSINMSLSLDQKSANETEERISDRIPRSSQGATATESRVKSMRSSARVAAKTQAPPTRVQELATENMDAIAVESDDVLLPPDAEFEENYPINMSLTPDQSSDNETEERTSDRILRSSWGATTTESRAKNMRSSIRVAAKIEALPTKVQELATESMVESDDAPPLPDADFEEDRPINMSSSPDEKSTNDTEEMNSAGTDVTLQSEPAEAVAYSVPQADGINVVREDMNTTLRVVDCLLNTSTQPDLATQNVVKAEGLEVDVQWKEEEELLSTPSEKEESCVASNDITMKVVADVTVLAKTPMVALVVDDVQEHPCVTPPAVSVHLTKENVSIARPSTSVRKSEAGGMGTGVRSMRKMEAMLTHHELQVEEELATRNIAETSVLCGSVESSEPFALPLVVTENEFQIDAASFRQQQSGNEMKQQKSGNEMEQDGRLEFLQNDNEKSSPEVVPSMELEEEDGTPPVIESREDETEHLTAENLAENIPVYVDNVVIHKDDMPVILSDSGDLVLLKEALTEYSSNYPAELAEKEFKELSCNFKSDVDAIPDASHDDKLNREDFATPSVSAATLLAPSTLATCEVLEARGFGAKNFGIASSTPDTTSQTPMLDLPHTEEAPNSVALQAVDVDELMDSVVVCRDDLQDDEVMEKEKVELGSLGMQAFAIQSGGTFATSPLPSFEKKCISVTVRNTKPFTEDKEKAVLLLANATTDSSLTANNAKATGEDKFTDKKQLLGKRKNRKLELPAQKELMKMSMRQLKKQFTMLSKGNFTAPSSSAATFCPSPLASSEVLAGRSFGVETSGIAPASPPYTGNQTQTKDHSDTKVPLVKEASAIQRAPALATTPLSSSGKISISMTAHNTKLLTDDKENSVVLLFANATTSETIADDELPDNQEPQGKNKRRLEQPSEEEPKTDSSRQIEKHSTAQNKRRLEQLSQEELKTMSLRQLKKQLTALNLSRKQNVNTPVDASHA